MDNENLKNLIQQEIRNYMNGSQYSVTNIPSHLHNGVDTPKITIVELPIETPVKIGLGGMIPTSFSHRKLVSPSSASEQIMTSIFSGQGQTGGIGIESPNLQFNLLHLPNNTSNQSFITAQRPPLFGTPPNTTIAVIMGGNTVAVSNYGFTVNELAGASINIYNSAGTFIESQIIASNTASVITITGTWLASTSGGSFFIYQPVFFGSADTIYQRFYTEEDTGGGIRFGRGTTGGGQNGLLYMDSVGDLYWRDKGNRVGSSTTQFDITNPAGTTFRYTYDGTGTDPVINATTFPIGSSVVVSAQNFNVANNGTFTITGSGANYFEVTNAIGVVESNKTIGTGYIRDTITTKLN